MKHARLLLCAALVFVVLIGGSDLGRFVTVIRIGVAVIGAAVIAGYVLRAPREHDAVDRLLLLGLVAFLITCVFSSMPRASFDAATTATAFAAAFYLARGVVAEAKGRQLAISTLGIIGCVFSILFLVRWGSLWLQWIQLTGTVPPLDLFLPATPYRHPYLVGMLAALLVPATIHLARRPVIWPIGVAGTIASICVAFMSGSRTVWLGGVLAILVVAVIAGRRQIFRLTWRWVIAGSASALALLLLSGSVIGRLAASSTVTSRLGIWDASISHWLESPLIGFGPGTFASQLTISGYYATRDGLVPHGHNAAIQLLVESGVLGILILIAMGAAVLLGLRQHSTMPIAPLAGMAVFAGTALTDNPTVIPYLVAPALTWAALALPRNVQPAESSPRWFRPTALAAAAIVGLASAATLMAAVTYDSAARSASDGDTTGVIDRLSTAIDLDPANPLYHRDLATWSLASGDTTAAEMAANQAVRLNPGDTAAYRVAAVVAVELGDASLAERRAKQAAALRSLDPLDQLTLAYVAMEAGDKTLQHVALADTVRANPWVAATPEWQRYFATSTSTALVAASSQAAAPAEEPNPRSRAWLAAMIGRPLPSEAVGPIQAAAADVIDCRLDEARSTLNALPNLDRVSAEGLLVQIFLAHATGANDDRNLKLLELHYPPFALLAEHEVGGVSPLTGPAEDLQMYGRLSLPPPEIGPTLPISEGGLSAWIRDPFTAARLGAPNSALATCFERDAP